MEENVPGLWAKNNEIYEIYEALHLNDKIITTRKKCKHADENRYHTQQLAPECKSYQLQQQECATNSQRKLQHETPHSETDETAENDRNVTFFACMWVTL